MKYLRITIVLIAMLTLILIGACCGDVSNTGSQNSGQSVQNEDPKEPEEPEEPEEPGILEFSGTDFAGLLEAWENLGEDPDDLIFYTTDYEMDESLLIEWHISEIAPKTMDVFTMEIEEGWYILMGLGGSGIGNFFNRVFDADGEIIGQSTLDGPDTETWLRIPEDMEITIQFDPASIWENSGSGIYCWFLYHDEN